jgi:hypothetical protein
VSPDSPLAADLTADLTADAVTFAFTVSNADTAPVDLTFRSGMRADVAVSDEDDQDREVWRWSEGRMFTQVVETETLEPDESTTVELRWDDPPPGTYLAEASLAAADVAVTDRVSFEVT